MLRVATVATLLLGCSCSSQVPRTCTEIGCQSAVQIDFQKKSPWAAGTYTVTATLDGGEPHSCEVVLPLSCHAPSCADEVLMVHRDGCALAPEKHAISGVTINAGSPPNIKVEVSHDGAPLGSGVFTPTYETVRPNGPGCEPECHG
ncbi:MAG: hypothetical protein ACPG77_02315, partial [Nannocystaceae bacterium]